MRVARKDVAPLRVQVCCLDDAGPGEVGEKAAPQREAAQQPGPAAVGHRGAPCGADDPQVVQEEGQAQHRLGPEDKAEQQPAGGAGEVAH